jgi:hypothetical protein
MSKLETLVRGRTSAGPARIPAAGSFQGDDSTKKKPPEPDPSGPPIKD